MTISDNTGGISIDPGTSHKVDAFSTDSAAKPPTTGQVPPRKKVADDENVVDRSASIDQRTSDREDEDGSPPDQISAVDADGSPPEKPTSSKPTTKG